MIISRYLSREIALALLAVSVLLLLIFLSGTFVRILSDAAEGDYPAGMVFSLFGLKALANLVLVLPLALFLAVLLALGRLYKDSEMAAMLACGISPNQVLRIVFLLSLAVAAVVALLALYFAPWAESRNQQLLDVATQTAEIRNVVPGRFNEAGKGNVLYAESMSPDRRVLYNVFVHSRSDERSGVLAARTAEEAIDPQTGDRYLVMNEGYRYEGNPGAADYRIIRFQTHSLLLKEQEVSASAPRRQALPTQALWQSSDKRQLGELQRRISVVLSTILLALLAVPLSKTNPRQGRYARLFVGILLYLVYNNLLTVSQAWLAKGKLSPAVGLWWVHILALILVVAFMAQENRWLRRRRR